jgi:hypothetical protein
LLAAGKDSEDSAAASRTAGELPKYRHFEVHPFFSICPSAIERRLTGLRRAHVPIGSSQRRH